MPNRQLYFDMNVGRQKPETIHNRENACPFCNPEELQDAIARDGNIALVKNKYPVLRDSFQTVLVETDDCNAHLGEYDKEHLHRLIRFGVREFIRLEESGEYQSVMFYKNHGPLSGGSIHHPHMQIVGLKNADCMEHIVKSTFEGVLIYEELGVEMNVATHPRVGFVELNIRLSDFEKIDVCADCIQIGVHYILNHFHRMCNSYNLFFYRIDGYLYVKLIPRFVTSPIFIGYTLPQVSNRIQDVAKEIQERYFSA